MERSDTHRLQLMDGEGFREELNPTCELNEIRAATRAVADFSRIQD
jgi:hypothetical protein